MLVLFSPPGNAIERNGTRTHRAGQQGSVEGTVLIHRGGLPARIFQRVHFTVQHPTALLHPLVVAPAYNRPRCTNTAPIGMSPSAYPLFASSKAACKQSSVSSIHTFYTYTEAY